jgi:hypothetical protein
MLSSAALFVKILVCLAPVFDATAATGAINRKWMFSVSLIFKEQ